MKIIFNHSIRGLFMSLIGLVAFTSCSEDFPGNVESDKFTDLKAIRILNAGAAGNQVLEGDIDEKTKVIRFPKMDTLTNFSNIKFEAEASNGAFLEKTEFSIPYQSGDTKTDINLKIVNNPRFKEYKAEIRFKVPIYGADFSLPTYYDYSANPMENPTYEAFSGSNTRGSGFDGKYVLIVNRGTYGIHLLEVDKIKQKVLQRIPLNSTGIVGGTFTSNMGAQVKGHSYVANLSGSYASPLKIYHWDSNNPTKAPDLVANINVDLLSKTGLGVRHGDNFSINLDDSGNGYAYFLSTDKAIIRVKITNFKEASEIVTVSTPASYEQWGHFNRVAGTDSYILSGHSLRMSLVNSSATASYTPPVGTFPVGSSDFRVINFNGERYLLSITVNRGAPNGTALILNVHNITRGANIEDALIAFSQTDKAPVFSHILVGTSIDAPGSQTGFYVQKNAQGKDEKLLIYGAGNNAGFAIIEFPLNVEKED